MQPEEVVIMQSDTIQDHKGQWDESKAFFYIILNGDFKVSGLKFNKRKKTGQEKAIEVEMEAKA